MGIGMILLVSTCPFWVTTQVAAQDHRAESPLSNALRFFERLPRADVGAALRTVRTPPLPSRQRALVRATLPTSGELTPTPIEKQKLEALEEILAYHERHQVFDVKIVDAPQAGIGLHGRAILVISRHAMSLVSSEELQALAAHEIGHDFFWAEFVQAERRSDALGRQELELRCDGIAVLTLTAMGLDPTRLVGALKKLQRFNVRRGAVLRLNIYPTPEDRERLVSALARREETQ
jgi:hypothetical protein